MSTVAAVIGNYEGEMLLPDVLASLARQTHRPVESIVVDAGSRDASVAVAESLGARALVLPNRGLGYLYNRGAERTEADYLMLLNNDVALAEDCVARLAAALDDDPDRFCADARQLNWAGERTIHARTTLSRGGIFHEYLPGLHLDPVARADVVTPTVCGNGAAMLVRRSQFVELEGFDETFFMEWEDLDLCWRAWLRGWASVYVPDAVVRHRVGAVTTASEAPRRSASSHHNLIRFALKCLPWLPACLVIAGEVLRLPAHPRAVAHGMSAALLETPAVLRARIALPRKKGVFAALMTDNRLS